MLFRSYNFWAKASRDPFQGPEGIDFGIRDGQQIEFCDEFKVFGIVEQGESRARGPGRLKDARGRPGKPMEGKEMQI